MTRRKIATANSLGGRRTLYEIDGGLEMLSRHAVDLVRTRVFWDDVVMVTHHRQVPLPETLVLAALTGVLLLTAMLWVAGGQVIVAGFNVILAGIPGLQLAVYLVRRRDVVTVFGRRSKVMAFFLLDKARSRIVFDEVCARVRRKHREMEAAAAAEAPPLPAVDDELLAPPPAGSVGPGDGAEDVPQQPPN